MIDRSGQQFGNYRLLDLLGRGSFAEVYLGEHIRLDTLASVKVLRITLMEEEIAAFRSQARTLATMDHPHLLRLLEYGTEEFVPFLISKHAPGGSLRKLHPRGSQLPLSLIVHYVKQIASALQYSHDRRVIHRNIKPENVLLNRQQMVVLTDFNIPAITRSITHSTQEMSGSATYLAPEQFQNKAHRASDQYALGIMVYEWLCGRRPFHGSFKELASQHVFSPPPPLREQLPTLPPEVEQVVLRALEKNASQRFPTVLEFAEALEQASLVIDAGQPAIVSPSRDEARSDGNTAYVRAFVKEPHEAETGFQPDDRTSQVATAARISSASASSTPSPAVKETEEEPQPSPAARKMPHLLSRRSLMASIAIVGVAGAGILAVEVPRFYPRLLSFLAGFGKSTSRPSRPPPSAALPRPQPTPTYTPVSIGTKVVTYRGHQKAVRTAVWSPDGTRLASAGDDQTIQIWMAANGAHVLVYKGHSGNVNALSWSPDGTRLASASDDQTIQIWDALFGSPIFTYKGHSGPVNAVSWSPDGQHIASAGNDQTVQVWSASSNSNIFIYKGHASTLQTISWSPDGRRLASGDSNGLLQIWNASDGGHVLTYRGHLQGVEGLAWSPDGKRLASASWDKTVQICGTLNGETIITYQGHNNIVWSVAWSPDGRRLVSASFDKSAQIWDAVSGAPLFNYSRHSDSVQHAAWSPDGSLIATASRDQTVRVWGAG